MPINESDIKEFVKKACAMKDGHLLDSISIVIPSSRTARSYIEHAKVLCGDTKAAEEIAAEVWSHVEDIVSSAEQEGKTESVFKLILYRARQTAGSRTWRTDVAPNGGTLDETESNGSNASMAGALVSGMHELRLTVKDLVSTVQASASEGWKLAGEALKAERKLAVENAELMVVVATQDQTDKNDPMKLLAVKAGSEIIEFIKIQGLAKIQAEIEAKAKAESEKKAIETQTTEDKK